MHQIQKDKFHVVSPEAFSPKPLNEVQKRLQAILDYWGLFHFLEADTVASVEHMDAAAEELGFDCAEDCSDSGFENARKMVLRAIALAGEP